MSQWVFVLSSLSLFLTPLCLSCPLSFIWPCSPLIYVAEEQLSRAGRKVGQAGRLQALQSPNTELIVSHTHTFLLYWHTSHTVTSIHIHLKARQEGVGSWTHISWVSIEVQWRELWRLGLETLHVTSASLKYFLCNFPESTPYTSLSSFIDKEMTHTSFCSLNISPSPRKVVISAFCCLNQRTTRH